MSVYSPEVITQGDDFNDAAKNAIVCLNDVIVGYLADNIPKPKYKDIGISCIIQLSITLSAKVSMHNAKLGITINSKREV